MAHKTEDLVSQFSGLILNTFGNHTTFDEVSDIKSVRPASLIFMPSDYEHHAININPAVIITTEDAAKELNSHYSGFIACVKNVKLAQALIKQHYDDYLAADSEWPDIHESAVVHHSAFIGTGCRIGPNVTIGANCKIGNNVIIRANSVIEHDVNIGTNSIINNLVNVGYGCIIGNHATLQSGCIIGGEGYGFATDDKNIHHRIPHTGNVVIEDDVHIGNNCCIDRGTYGSTIIKRGVKIDNLCHIAHNVEIGEDSLLTAQCVIAGSSVIGKRVMMSGQTGVLDHKTVPDDTVLVHRAGVTESLPHGGMWAGSPAKPFKEFVRGLRAGKRISRLEQDIKQLKKLLIK